MELKEIKYSLNQSSNDFFIKISDLKTQKDELETVVEDEVKKILLDILSVYDSFESFLNNINKEMETIYDSCQIINELFQIIFSKYKLITIKCDGKVDPKYHKVVGAKKVENKKEWELVEVTINGYMYEGKILRYAEIIRAL